jgi:mRNA-degrading endonuclease RelE of RelBE toxin-antitoxin system
MIIRTTKTFDRCYIKLASQVQSQVNKQLSLFLNNPRHPSLNIKKMKGQDSIWEGRVNEGYRFTFQIENNVYILRKVGTHNVLKKP